VKHVHQLESFYVVFPDFHFSFVDVRFHQREALVARGFHEFDVVGRNSGVKIFVLFFLDHALVRQSAGEPKFLDRENVDKKFLVFFYCVQRLRNSVAQSRIVEKLFVFREQSRKKVLPEFY
jgi:hypothetical protein